jgi:hypothetical protein
LTNGQVPQLFQGRSSAGAQSYPGDRAFYNQRLPTIQIHNLKLIEDDQTLHNNVPAVAIKIPNVHDVLIHED